ncbi:MAG: hypothetical protein AAFW46_10600 [Pseudomonadota bacterium]
MAGRAWRAGLGGPGQLAYSAGMDGQPDRETITLSPELTARARDAVARGEAASVAEYVEMATLDFDAGDLDSLSEEQVAFLHREIDIGLASGPAEPFDPEAFLGELRAKNGG